MSSSDIGQTMYDVLDTLDFYWIVDNWAELKKMYPGQFIVVRHGRVVYNGRKSNPTIPGVQEYIPKSAASA